MILDEALEIIGKLSEASKMPCFTYNLPPKNCQRGRKLHQFKNTVCSKCYARRGNFARPTIIAHLERKLAAIMLKEWVDAMTLAIISMEDSGYFRWHSAGDLQGLWHLIKICEVARRTPHIKHWLPTHEIGILGDFKRAGFSFPPNLIVRVSGDVIDKEPPRSLLRNLGVFGGAVSKTNYNCPAPKQGNKCMTCRKCWDKRHVMITYKYH